MSDPGVEALHRIDTHEQVCSERYANLMKQNVVFHDRLNGMSNRMWAAALGICVMALSAAGTLAVSLMLLSKSVK